jgi:hypothetical protein
MFCNVLLNGVNSGDAVTSKGTISALNLTTFISGPSPAVAVVKGIIEVNAAGTLGIGWGGANASLLRDSHFRLIRRQ